LRRGIATVEKSAPPAAAIASDAGHSAAAVANLAAVPHQTQI
jgi:hypothetical protein